MSKKSLLVMMIILISMPLMMSNCGKKKEAAPTTIKAAHILLMYKDSEKAPDNITRTKEEAYNEIQQILEKLKAGEDFGKLALDHSDHYSSSSKGGELGEFGRGEMMKPFEDAAFKLKTGEISGIVETKLGYHIIKRL